MRRATCATALILTLTACSGAKSDDARSPKTGDLAEYVKSAQGQRDLERSRRRAMKPGQRQQQRDANAAVAMIEGEWRGTRRQKNGDMLVASFSRDRQMTLETYNDAGARTAGAKGTLSIAPASVYGTLDQPKGALAPYANWMVRPAAGGKATLYGKDVAVLMEKSGLHR